MTNTHTEEMETLNELIERAERALASQRIHVRATIEVEGRKLSFKKTSGGWRLVWLNADGNIDSKVINTSRRLRVAVANAIPEMYEAIVAADQEQRANVCKAIEDLEPFIEQLEAKARAAGWVEA